MGFFTDLFSSTSQPGELGMVFRDTDAAVGEIRKLFGLKVASGALDGRTPYEDLMHDLFKRYGHANKEIVAACLLEMLARAAAGEVPEGKLAEIQNTFAQKGE